MNKDLNMWLIPVKDLEGIKNSIRLRTEPNSNNQGLQTYVYHVSI